MPARLLQPPAPQTTDDDRHDDDAVSDGDMEVDADMGYNGSLEPGVGDFVSEIPLQQLGSHGRS